MRIRDVSGDRLEATRLRERLLRAYGELDALHALLDSTNYPVWLRDRMEKLVWVNAAYVRAVEAKDSADALLRGTELLERTTREQDRGRAAGTIWRGRAAAVAAGQRHLLDVIEVPVSVGSAGLAADASQMEALRADMARLTKAHAANARPALNRRRHLRPAQAARLPQFRLPPALVAAARLLSTKILGFRNPRPAARGTPATRTSGFPRLERKLLTAYQSFETSEQVWYLPDGRTLRVVINPNPQGVTYLFDDVTERFHLESRFNALARVQSETARHIERRRRRLRHRWTAQFFQSGPRAASQARSGTIERQAAR